MQIPLGIKKAAALCVLRHKQKYLLLKRNKQPNKGMYAPVGGKIDPFETPLNAAKRETFEETGIQVTDMKFCGILTESSPLNYNWISYIYLADVDLIKAPICPEGELEWIKAEDLKNIPMPPTDWFIYEYILIAKPFTFSAVYDKDLKMIQLIEEIEGKITL